MKIKEISSSSNIEVKYLKKIRKGAEPFFLVEGEQLITIAIECGFDAEAFWFSQADEFPEWTHNSKIRIVPNSIYTSFSPTKVSTGPLGVFRRPMDALRTFENQSGRYLLLDGIQDPGNAGALIRAAAGFNLDGVIWFGNRPGLYHHSLIRSSAGTVFQMKHLELCKDFQMNQADEQQIFIGTAATGGACIPEYRWPKSFVLCLGNEGHGHSSFIESMCSQLVSIPINPKVESLNVAGAAHVLLYQSNQIIHSMS